MNNVTLDSRLDSHYSQPAFGTVQLPSKECTTTAERFVYFIDIQYQKLGEFSFPSKLKEPQPKMLRRAMRLATLMLTKPLGDTKALRDTTSP